MSAANEPLRRAMTLIAQRDFSRALREGEAALKADPKHAGAHQLVGTLHCQLGAPQKGVPLLERSLQLAENQTTRLNLAQVLLGLDRIVDADAVLAKAAPTPDAHRLRGDAAKKKGDLPAAIAAYRQAVRIKPDYADAWNNLGNTLREAGDAPGALEALEQAVRFNPRAPLIQVNLARALQALDRAEEAFRAVQAALRIAPNDPAALLESAKLHNQADRYDEALALLQRVEPALRADGDFWTVKGAAHAGADQPDRAEAAYREAIRLTPSAAGAYVGLGYLLESLSRLDEAEAIVDEAERRVAGADAFLMLRAALLRRRGKLEEALARAAAAPHPTLVQKIARAALIAQCADRLDDAPRAFAAMQEMNALKAQTQSARGYDAGAFADKLEKLDAQLTPEWIESWRPLRASQTRPAPVFLLGFPRSGTTLLDSMLRGHPRIAVLEELPLMERVSAALGDAANAAALDDARADELRALYFRGLDALGLPPERDVVIDKLPFHIADTVLIHRLFPDARFIFALRHPCDAVLSCFMQNFQVNFAMAAFLDIGQSARLYDRAMTYWTHCQERLNLSPHTLRYEALVEESESEMRALIGFLGLGWNERVLAHQANAAGRTRVRTPSYWQVTEKLYTRAAGRWRRYADQLAPVLPVLEPWAARFGY